MGVNCSQTRIRPYYQKPLLKGHPFGRTREGTSMPLKLGPAGVPLSCKGRTIVEGMDDITALGLEAMEIQTVRPVQPKHFDQLLYFLLLC